MGFPMAVALVVVLGSLLVLWARTDREATSAPRVGDHWHSVYDIYVCDSFRSKVVLETDPNGIHTHGDGLLHIHPFNKLASGRDAVLGEFFSAFGGRIDDASVVLDTGEELVEGADCGGQPTVLKVARFDADDLERDPEVVTEDLAGVRFLKNREAFTVAMVPADVEPPAPRSERLTFLDIVSPDALSSDPLAPAPTTSE
ncbi:uncharacterized protein METZ01_LOCUS131806 [marine metagenome]|jgi:hypothetical protein|uniref:Uncharacterized protein n=1 Tax=marine metagenome TaxID=408172 RepID=A0A381YQP9_9ZZZZ|tara:strand:- start:321 stop:920 length:600 start_codon:yes stop_codon:yes gene_type:complete